LVLEIVLLVVVVGKSVSSATCDFPANSIAACSDSVIGSAGNSGVTTWSNCRFLGFFVGSVLEDIAESVK